MVSVHLICVGKLKEKHFSAACGEYEKRLKPFCKLTITELPEERLPEEPSPAQIDAALEMTGLMPLRSRNIMTLSGGELQRAFLAQVLAQDPKLLILDEPANHLDLPFQKQFFDMVQEWLKQPGRAVITVMHDLTLAKKYGTHALLMNEGKAAAQGAAEEVLTRENLQAVYGMDVFGWMKELYTAWDLGN